MKRTKLLLSIALLVVSTSFLTNCSQKDLENLSAEEVSSKYETYLSLASGKIPAEPTDEEWEIIDEAFSRLDLERDSNGITIVKQKSGKEINISEELFYSLHRRISNANRSRLNATQYATRVPSDCVATCIHMCTRSLGSSLSYGDINTWICEKFKTISGVPADSVESVINHFFVYTRLTPPLSTVSGIEQGDLVIIIRQDAHAVMLKELRGLYVICEDYQLMHTDGVTQEDIECCYVYDEVSQAFKIEGLKSNT